MKVRDVVRSPLARFLLASVVVAAGLVAVSLSGISEPDDGSRQCRALPSDPPRILLVGDSITQQANGDRTWRYLLWRKLRTTAPEARIVGPRRDLFDPVNRSFGGLSYVRPFPGDRHDAEWGRTMSETVPTVANVVAEADPTVVVVMLGSNDLQGGAPPAYVHRQLRSLVTSIQGTCRESEIIVAEALPRFDITTATSPLKSTFSQYNRGLESLVRDMSTAKSKVTTAAITRGWVPTQMTWDGIHPDPFGESHIAQRISEALSGAGVGSSEPDLIRDSDWAANGPKPRVTPIADGTVRVEWERASTGADAMQLELGSVLEDGGKWDGGARQVGGDSFVWKDLVPGKTYAFRLSPVRGTMVGVPGAVTFVTATGIQPQAPKGVRVEGSVVRWDPVLGADGYQVQGREAGGVWTGEFGTGFGFTRAGGTQFRSTLTGPGQLRVRAINGLLVGPWATSPVVEFP